MMLTKFSGFVSLYCFESVHLSYTQETFTKDLLPGMKYRVFKGDFYPPGVALQLDFNAGSLLEAGSGDSRTVGISEPLPVNKLVQFLGNPLH